MLPGVPRRRVCIRGPGSRATFVQASLAQAFLAHSRRSPVMWNNAYTEVADEEPIDKVHIS